VVVETGSWVIHWKDCWLNFAVSTVIIINCFTNGTLLYLKSACQKSRANGGSTCHRKSSTRVYQFDELILLLVTLSSVIEHCVLVLICACADRASASWTVTLSNSELIIPDVTRVGWHILAFQFPLCDGKQYVFTRVCLCVMIFVITRTSLNSDKHLE